MSCNWRKAQQTASPSSTMAPRAGAGSSASSPASKRDPKAPTPVLFSRRPRQARLRAALLRPRPSREPHQGVEEPPRRRSHLLPRGRGQPVSPLPARRRLLALVVNAPRHAQTLSLARHAIRHLAAALGQTRRPRRRAENPAQDPPAVERPRPGNLRHAPRPPAASHRLTEGACAPEPARFPSTFSAHSIPPTNPPQRDWIGSSTSSSYNQSEHDIIHTQDM